MNNEDGGDPVPPRHPGPPGPQGDRHPGAVPPRHPGPPPRRCWLHLPASPPSALPQQTVTAGESVQGGGLEERRRCPAGEEGS